MHHIDEVTKDNSVFWFSVTGASMYVGRGTFSTQDKLQAVVDLCVMSLRFRREIYCDVLSL